mgnify:CR=1 FL=1
MCHAAWHAQNLWTIFENALLITAFNAVPITNIIIPILYFTFLISPWVQTESEKCIKLIL